MRIATDAFQTLDVRTLASLVASGELTPDDVVEATLERIHSLEDKVHAWSLLDEPGARAQAKALTAEAAAGKLRGPLHGVPVGIKDEFHIAGMPTGMRGGENIPLEPEDATVVTRLRQAGAIIMGKTHMVVGGKSPPTRNPWNLEHTAGGTSSGSGAAVGTRMVPFAIGEQTAGSNLRPAAYCGVSGLKPTYGRISRFGCYPFTWSFDHVGIIGLSMADIALVLSVVAGPDPRDPSAYDEPPPPADLHIEGVRPPRVGIVRNYFPERSEDEAMDAVEKGAKQLQAAGANVSDFLLPDDFDLVSKLRPLFGGESAVFNAQRSGRGGGRAASLIPATYYLHARRVRAWLAMRIQAIFDDYDALLMPTAPSAAPKGLESTGDSVLLRPWSFLGFPAITISGGLSPDGLPLGLQFVGARKGDYRLLQTGAWCEQVLGRLPAPVIQ
jgi:aspartyl-tRNA(Asn)/glutamyl-tRNA(Gln) amidotransferase subunit A